MSVVRITAEGLVKIDASEQELHHPNIIITRKAERERRIAAVREQGKPSMAQQNMEDVGELEANCVWSSFLP